MSTDQWVVLELSAKAEGEDPDIVRKSIAYTIRGAEVYIPATITQVGGDRVVHYLVEGYAFIRHKHPEEIYSRLEDTKYVSHVVRKMAGVGHNGRPLRRIATISTSDIERMKRQTHDETDQGIDVGDVVLITSGAYKQLESEVLTNIEEEEKVQVRILLKSKDTIVTLPRSFLKLLRKASKDEQTAFKRPPKEERPAPSLSGFTGWLGKAKGLLSVLSQASHLVPVSRVLLNYGVFLRVEDWMSVLERDVRFIRSLLAPPLDLKPLRELEEKTSLLNRWVDRVLDLYNTLRAGVGPKLDVNPLDDGFLRLLTLESYLEQLQEIESHVEQLEDDMDMSQLEGTQNVIIDGLNLAYRCFYAPGISELKSSSGQPTGMVFGFLQVLVSLRKKFPNATIHVAWDGSNQFRKTLFDGYKAHRHSELGYDQVAFLKELLPSLGVIQAVSPEEEADDIIASMVRGPLADQKNVVLSTDNDLFQLVSEKTFLLLPAQGKRKETICDETYVRETWGVPVSSLVSLRALLGDTSDNIPGVPTVPEGILKSLLQTYGSISGIFSSNLAGLTKKRYDALQGSEKQIRLNEQLMTLRSVPFRNIDPVPDASSIVRQLSSLDIRSDSIVTHFFPGFTPS